MSFLAEDDWRKALDAEPDNHNLKLVFADWLEERGDWRAVGYRWMGENQKTLAPPHPPQPMPRPGEMYFNWWWEGVEGEGPESCKLPYCLYETREIKPPVPRPRGAYPTRQEGEEALCQALLGCPQAVQTA